MPKLQTESELPVAFENKEPQIANFPIVGIGASAGGLEAFTQLLEALPADTGMAFVYPASASRSQKRAHQYPFPSNVIEGCRNYGGYAG